jgi:Phage tail lysozyme
MKITELINEDDTLGQFIQQTTQSSDPIGDLASKFMSALSTDDDEIAQIAKGKKFPSSRPTNNSLAPVKKPTNTPAAIVPSTHQSKPSVSAPKPAVPVPIFAGGVPWQSVATYLKTKWKLSNNHIAGMLANIGHESSFNPATDVVDSNGLPSGGLFQHNGPRYRDMVTNVKNWKTNWQGQIDFALSEPLGRSYISKNFPNPVMASEWWTKHFENPANKDIKAVQRSKVAPGYAAQAQRLGK